MKNVILFLAFSIYAFAKAPSAYSQNISRQTLSGTEVIAKSIAYHDPDNRWSSFRGVFALELETPNKPVRKSTITINLPEHYFNLTTEQDGNKTFREISDNQCKFSNENGKLITTPIDDDQCERTRMFNNYYTYLYGLPMKLKDAGTHIDPIVKKVIFKEKEYLVVKVTYDKAVGADAWLFYLNPNTYAMEVYQFYKNGEVNTGEYILLSGLTTVEGIKMPKDRAWYYNKDDGYLGTDKMISQ